MSGCLANPTPNTEGHGPWRKSSEWIWVWQRRKRRRRIRRERAPATGRAQVERILSIHRLTKAALKTRVREDLTTLPDAEEYFLDRCRTVARALDHGESGGHIRQHTMWYGIYGWLEATTYDIGHHLAWSWPELGLSVPSPRPDANEAPSWHRQSSLGTRKRPRSRQQKASPGRPPPNDAQGQEPAPGRRRRRQLAKASSRCGETSHSSQAARAEQQRCTGQRRRA